MSVVASTTYLEYFMRSTDVPLYQRLAFEQVFSKFESCEELNLQERQFLGSIFKSCGPLKARRLTAAKRRKFERDLRAAALVFQIRVGSVQSGTPRQLDEIQEEVGDIVYTSRSTVRDAWSAYSSGLAPLHRRFPAHLWELDDEEEVIKIYWMALRLLLDRNLHNASILGTVEQSLRAIQEYPDLWNELKEDVIWLLSRVDVDLQ